jgi:uncharacterized protein
MAKAGKQFSDPIHGVVALNDLEVGIVCTRTFQRLRNVKQLGLAHYVFPGADYSRFSHSLGACHVMGRILKVLREQEGGGNLSDAEIQKYRIAALLHDVGHYPFSHATEYAFKNVYSSSLFEKAGQKDSIVGYIMHESVTGLILREDPEISKILRAAGIEPDEIENTIRRQEPKQFLSNLISSDLDADRIDYLLRTAHHAGLPYGSVDIDYLLTQMRLDSSGRVCLTPKALRAAEHMLLCRYFDYQQVTYHRAVAGFEWLLKGCIADLVSSEKLDGSKPAIESRVRSGAWSDFDDGELVTLIRGIRAEPPSAIAGLRAAAVLDRRPPVVLAQDEQIVQRDALRNNDRRKLYDLALEKCATKHGLPPDNFTVWDPGPMTLTKIGGHVDASDIAGSDSKKQDALEQAVRIIKRDGTSEPMQQDRSSLMSVLSDHGVRPLRLYGIVDESQRDLIKEMRKTVSEALTN